MVVLPSSGEVITGAAGASVSMRKALVFDGGEELPAASVEITYAPCRPAANGVVGVKKNSPALFAVVVPIEAPSTKISTSAPGSAPPLNVGVLSLVTSPSAGRFSVGATGASVSMVKSLTFDRPEVTPFSLARAEAS